MQAFVCWAEAASGILASGRWAHLSTQLSRSKHNHEAQDTEAAPGDRVPSCMAPVGRGPPCQDPPPPATCELSPLENKIKVKREHLKISVKWSDFRIMRCGNDCEL